MVAFHKEHEGCEFDKSCTYPYSEGNMLVKAVCVEHGPLVVCACGQSFASEDHIKEIDGVQSVVCPNCHTIWTSKGKYEPHTPVVYVACYIEHCDTNELIGVGVCASKLEAIVKMATPSLQKMDTDASHVKAIRFQFIDRERFDELERELSKKVDKAFDNLIDSIFRGPLK